jgi:hypothetical protein
MLATVLAQPAKTEAARTAKWRQLIDLLAQRREHATSQQVEAALSYLREHRDEVDPSVRKDIAASLSGRHVSRLLLKFFGEDTPSVAMPIISTAQLQPREWLELLPTMSVTGRALLRNRRDLHPSVSQALAAFGSSDFALAGVADTIEREPSEAGARDLLFGENSEAQIRELVARIEAHRQQPRPNETATSAMPQIDGFRWETGPDGVILWVEGAPRGPLVGQTIAAVAENGQCGVDGQAAGAFEKRAPFRDARFSVAGTGAASGDWRISGVPFFDQRMGSFLGYRGSARRPRLDEVARPHAPAHSAGGLFGTDVPAEALRQLIHELRTPLNAIVGFAEMIEGQYMGPAAANYRGRAHVIVEQATRLLAAVDDLDTAARLETRKLVLDGSSTDAVALLCRLHDAYEKIADQRRAKVAIEVARDLPPAKVELTAAERMFARLLAGAIGLARDGESITASMNMGRLGGRDLLCFSIDRPQAVAGLDEAALLDPSYSPEGEWPGAPALGLGFALRLIRNLAETAGGALVIGDRRFSLYLPTVGADELANGRLS